MAPPASHPVNRYPRTDTLRTTRRGNSPLPPYSSHQGDEQMFSEDPPQVCPICVGSEGLGIPLECLSHQPTAPVATQMQTQSRNQETCPPPPYPESGVPTPPASVTLRPEPIKQPFEEPYLLPISETRVISGAKRVITKKQKRKNKYMTRLCFTVLTVAIVLVFGVVGVSVWRYFEDKKVEKSD